MGITDSIYLKGNIIEITFEFCKTELLQNIKFELVGKTDKYFKDPISQRKLLKLNDNDFVSDFGRGLYHFKSETGKSANCFKVVDNNSVTKVSHLFIKWDDDSMTVITEESDKLYKSVLKLLQQHSSASDLIIRIGDEFVLFSELDIEQLFLQDVCETFKK